MRKVVLMMSISLDGYFEGPNREIDWHLVDEELHRYFNQKAKAMGAFLEGRVTYQLMADFWPTYDAGAEADSTDPMVEFAGIWRDMPKYVFSRTLEHADWNTTIVREVVPEEIRALKAQADGDMAVGGAELAAEFLRHDLVDEFHLCVHPVLIGRGRPLFTEADHLTRLQLVETRTFGNGVVLLRYERVGGGR
ncbi:dihydrofolate reductase family protein [Streptomyces sp. ME02-8801-2C]|uniref:dihydrofolate reductase family protein n=1 Tax=Streptomyces sp. ME02-8801-2C TaxID=3028680 RepID=UPI0029BAB16E|nr:dihydrofolate reductase family protein [Streptomyces sp. ME02-8801-2C]MDX3456963.1 dihydrofolate reductase family protein [Streptomyces sp. ME02-8801-2C]